MSSKKVPDIGTVFSSESSDEELISYKSKTSASEPEQRKTISLKVNLQESDHQSMNQSRTQSQADVQLDGSVKVEKQNVHLLRHNTIIQYEKNNGSIVKSKYFKKVDTIVNNIIVGFYKHNKRNYSESLDNIKNIYASSSSASGGSEALKDTIEIPKSQWNTIRRDMIISYQKIDNEFIYKSRFNSFIKTADGTTKMSLTNERGFNYIANPDKMIKLYRHVTPNDKTLTYILEYLQKQDRRIKHLESIIAKIKK